MGDRPTAAFVLSLIGGIFTLIIGPIAGAGFAAGLFGIGTLNYSVAAGAALVFFVVGVICAVMVIIGAALQYSEDRSRVRTASVIVLVFALVGIPFTLFGVLIGGILSVIGAGLGLSWKPSQPTASMQTPISRVCPSCGRVLTEDTKYCPNCGKALV